MNIVDFLSSIILPLIDYPESFRVKESRDDMGLLLTIDLHYSDMGAVIGKAGETAKAIRHIMRIVGLRKNARVSIKINEPIALAQ